ncbi:unnamed protein product [Lathyrus sativus]|nr:unnamed protein product [Lathyrus sativus]
MAPLANVLRIVDNESKPTMDYIYAAMRVAMESIDKAFNSNSTKYKVVFEIIDKRWEYQLHHPLHAAGYYLNPGYYYDKPEIENDPKLVTCLRRCIETLSGSHEVEDRISVQLTEYKGATVRQMSTLAPNKMKWWKSYRAETLDLQLLTVKVLSLSCSALQLLTVKVLSLSCSASEGERNWSIFEHIHSKKRNKLKHQRLQDLVFIKSNQVLIERLEIRDKIDLMVFSKINYHSEWLVGEMGEIEEDLFHDDQ